MCFNVFLNVFFISVVHVSVFVLLSVFYLCIVGLSVFLAALLAK